MNRASFSRIFGAAIAVATVVVACAEAPDDGAGSPSGTEDVEGGATSTPLPPSNPPPAEDAGKDSGPTDSGAKDASRPPPPKDSGTPSQGGGDCDTSDPILSIKAVAEAAKGAGARTCGPILGGTCKADECCFGSVCVDL